MDCWFNLPNGETVEKIEVTVPVKGRFPVYANLVQDVDRFQELMERSMKKRGWSHHGSLPTMLEACITGYEQIATDALEGASTVRDDMHVMLRSAVFVLQTVVCEHLNHSQKNERIRGCIAVLERHIQALREERFDFRNSTWRHAPDLFRWDEPERRLRERVRELEAKLNDRKETQESPPF